MDALAALRNDVDVPIATGDTVVGRRGFLPLLEHGAVDVVTVDVQWTGGLTEARKVASLADTYGVPVATHDCAGPATLAACIQLGQAWGQCHLGALSNFLAPRASGNELRVVGS